MNRTEKIRAKLAEMDLDALLVLNELNQHYLSGFAFTDGALLITKNRALLITDFRYYEMALGGAFKDYEIVMPDNRVEFITAALKEEGCKRVGFEGDSVSYGTYNTYKERYPFVEFVDIGRTVESLRLIKDETEIEKMQNAQNITDAAFTELLKVIKPDMTEIEVAAELEYQMRKLGASGLAFETIAVSGDASALPHGTPRNVKLRPGFLTMDFGAKFDGYCSDMTRTVVVGTADEKIKKLYNTVLEAQLSALEYLKMGAGADMGEADKAARDIIDAIDEYKGAFGHSLGHGVGLLIHEGSSLSARSFGKKLQRGEVVTVEPGIYLLGKYGCRIEDMVAIEDGGIRIFTHSPKDLIEII